MTCRKFHVITGASGSGKSTLVGALGELGYSVMPESALSVLQEHEQRGAPPLSKANLQEFMEEVLERSIRAYDAAQLLTPPVFFDRALPECLEHMRLLSLEIKPEFEAWLELRRYADTVFVVQPRPEIYVQDRWRKADFARASRSFEPTVAAYADRGYGIRIVPQVSVEERVAFVLQHAGAR